jgi:hypothetical protein
VVAYHYASILNRDHPGSVKIVEVTRFKGCWRVMYTVNGEEPQPYYIYGAFDELGAVQKFWQLGRVKLTS